MFWNTIGGTFVKAPKGPRGGVKVSQLILSYFAAFCDELLLPHFYAEKPNFWHVLIKSDVVEGTNSKNEPAKNFI